MLGQGVARAVPNPDVGEFMPLFFLGNTFFRSFGMKHWSRKKIQWDRFERYYHGYNKGFPGIRDEKRASVAGASLAAIYLNMCHFPVQELPIFTATDKVWRKAV